MSKHSIRIGRLSRLSASRSSSSASTRRSRLRSASATSDSSASRAFWSASSCEAALLAALGRPHLDARAAPLGEELGERVRVARLARHDDLRRDRRRRAVVLEAERLEHRRPCPGRRRSRGGTRSGRPSCPSRSGNTCTAARSPSLAMPDHVDRADRALVGRLPLGEVADREEPVPVARRVLEALLGGGLAHPALELPLDRPRLAGEELDHAVDQRPGSPPSRRSRRRARGSGRCGSRGTGSRGGGPASGPRTGRYWKTRFSTSSVSRTFFAFAYGPK